jgi:hypothetical protein
MGVLARDRLQKASIPAYSFNYALLKRKVGFADGWMRNRSADALDAGGNAAAARLSARSKPGIA